MVIPNRIPLITSLKDSPYLQGKVNANAQEYYQLQENLNTIHQINKSSVNCQITYNS